MLYSMEKVILSMDVGTTNMKASLWNEHGNLIASSAKALGRLFQEGFIVEQNPHEVWNKFMDTALETIATSKIDHKNITGIGIANQRESVLGWDPNTLEPVSNIISWQDRRTAKDTLHIKSSFGDEIREKSGLEVDSYFSAPKIKWILENVEKVKQLKVKNQLRIGTLDSWLVNKLTLGKEYFTDYTNASRTMLMNIARGSWDQDLLAIFSIPEEILPEIRPSSSRYGEILVDGPLRGKEILSVVGDQQSSLIGMGRIREGDTKVTIGTGTFMISSSGNNLNKRKGLLSTCLYSNQKGQMAYALEGSSFFSGSLLEFIKKNLFNHMDMDEIDPYPDTFASGNNVYFIPALAGLGSPFWDPQATGTITGIRPDTDWRDVSSAALQSIAFRIRDMIRAMNDNTSSGEIWIDGGVSKNRKLIQFISDITRLQIVQAGNFNDVTGRGAANLAFMSVDDHKLTEWALNSSSGTFTPLLSEEKAESLYQGWISALERSRLKKL